MEIKLKNGAVIIPAPENEEEIINIACGIRETLLSDRPSWHEGMSDGPAPDPEAVPDEKEDDADKPEEKEEEPEEKPRRKNAYSSEDIEKIVQMANDGCDAEEIAKAIGGNRTAAAINFRITQLKKQGLILKKNNYRTKNRFQTDDDDDDDDLELKEDVIEDTAGKGVLGDGYRPY